MESILPNRLPAKRVDADARILPAFVHHPGVSGMEAISLGNLKAALLHHERRGE